ncbi:uncharacterized protein PAE49_012626 [Odontesthes bonariensis]|uniref:uncharacterized protein LOC142391358 n=1 Tax=Odontesthes bonariensis TaxID=219752 RepID=UPI003F5879F7
MMPAHGEEHLVGRLPGLGDIGERPAAEGFPELPRIIDGDDGNSLVIYVSSDDENVLEGPVGVVYHDDDFPDVPSWLVADYFETWGIVDVEDSVTDSCSSEGSVYSISEGEVCWSDLEESATEDSVTDSCSSEGSVYSPSEGEVCWSDLEESDVEDSVTDSCSSEGSVYSPSEGEVCWSDLEESATEDSVTDSCSSEGSVYSPSEGEVCWSDLEESDVEDSVTDSCSSEGSVYSPSEGEVCWSDLEESDVEDSDCSASGPVTSRKRSREESEESKPDAKRPRKSCE